MYEDELQQIYEKALIQEKLLRKAISDKNSQHQSKQQPKKGRKKQKKPCQNKDDDDLFLEACIAENEKLISEQ